MQPFPITTYQPVLYCADRFVVRRSFVRSFVHAVRLPLFLVLILILVIVVVVVVVVVVVLILVLVLILIRVVSCCHHRPTHQQQRR